MAKALRELSSCRNFEVRGPRVLDIAFLLSALAIPSRQDECLVLRRLGFGSYFRNSWSTCAFIAIDDDCLLFVVLCISHVSMIRKMIVLMNHFFSFDS